MAALGTIRKSPFVLQVLQYLFVTLHSLCAYTRNRGK